MTTFEKTRIQLNSDLNLIKSFAKKNNKSFLISPITLYACLELSKNVFPCLQKLVDEFILTDYSYIESECLKIGTGIFGNTCDNYKQPNFPVCVTSDKSADIINKFIEQATGGMIKDSLSESDVVGAYLVLVSCLHFKCGWLIPFDPITTHKRSFTGLNGKVSVDMMSYTNNFSGKIEYHFIESDHFDTLVLPYEDKRFVAKLTLPKDSSVIDVRHVLDIHTQEYYEHILSDGKVETIVNICVPKFKINFKCSNILNNLSDSGFDANQLKDLTGVDQIIHHVSLEVDEKGTVGSAATSMIARCMVSCREWNGNRPFIFNIRDLYNNTTLFIGTIDLSVQE